MRTSIAACVFISVEGYELTSEEREILQHPAVYGVILFSKNYRDNSQLKSLTKAIHKISARLVIAVDQEGGRVQRFVEGFTQLPSMRHWGKRYQDNAAQTRDEIKAITGVMVKELQQHGVNLTLAPVLDVDHGVSTVIGERSFGADIETVVDLGGVVIDTMTALGMPATGKHFPGHGAVAIDSHIDLPTDPRQWDELWADCQPFVKLAPRLGAVMPAHIVYSSCDTEAAGFSRFWLQEVLRQRIGFQGVAMSDDLSMGGAAAFGGFQERAERALDAGCDLLLVCNNPAGAVEILETIERHPLSSESLYRINKFTQGIDL